MANYFEMKKIVTEKKDNMDLNEKDTKPLSLPKYLSKFEIPAGDKSSGNHYGLSKSITNEEKEKLGYFLFKNFFAEDVAYDEEYLLEFLRMIPLKKLDLLVSFRLSDH